MADSAIWEVIRSINTIGGVAVALMCFIVNRRRVKAKHTTSHELLFDQGVVVYILAASYSTFALINTGTPGGPRLLILAVGLAWMLIAIIQINRDERNH